MGAQYSTHSGCPDIEPYPEPCDPTKIITRAQWGALPAEEERFTKLKHPLKKVRAVYTLTDMCYNVNQCSQSCREIQQIHMDVGCPDIMHNFLIGADGNIYEGRGWDNESCIMQGDFALIGRTLDIGFIGPFLDRRVPDIIFKLGKSLILYGIEKNYLDEHYDCDTIDMLEHCHADEFESI